jgi:phosphoserine phosphatase
LRIKILQSISVKIVQDIIDKIKLHSMILLLAKKYNDRFFIVTGNLDIWIEKLIKKIGLQCFCSKADYDEDQLMGIKSILDKGEAIRELKKKFSKVIAVGEGMNDVPMFENADISIAFGAVHNPVESIINLSDYVVYDERSLCAILEMLL